MKKFIKLIMGVFIIGLVLTCVRDRGEALVVSTNPPNKITINQKVDANGDLVNLGYSHLWSSLKYIDENNYAYCTNVYLGFQPTFVKSNEELSRGFVYIIEHGYPRSNELRNYEPRTCTNYSDLSTCTHLSGAPSTLGGYSADEYQNRAYYITQMAVWWYMDINAGIPDNTSLPTCKDKVVPILESYSAGKINQQQAKEELDAKAVLGRDCTGMTAQKKAGQDDDAGLFLAIKQLIDGARAADANGDYDASYKLSADSSNLILNGEYFESKLIRHDAKNTTGTYVIDRSTLPKGTIILDSNNNVINGTTLTGSFKLRVPASSMEEITSFDVSVTATTKRIIAYRYVPDPSDSFYIAHQGVLPTIPYYEEKEDKISDKIRLSTNGITYKSCDTKVTKGSCDEDFVIAEPTDRECVVNNSAYRYKSVGDCGIIYCSQNIKTDFGQFHTVFNQIITSGSYVAIDALKLDITRTCYIETIVENSICNNWYTNITKDEAGSIKLQLVSSYNLIETESSRNSEMNVNCTKYSNGRCVEATASQHIEYGLEPNTNKYISLIDMAGTGTNTGNNIVDLSSERVTTPIYLATGTHNYNVNYQNSILQNIINRLTSQYKNITDTRVLKYGYNQNLTLDDLSYSCDYSAKNNNGLSDCAGECCNNQGQVVECGDPDKTPGGFPNVIYRPINLVEAFPGQDGLGRNPGTNWSGNVYDIAGNIILKTNGQPYTKEEYYINNNRGYNDYDVYQAEPLYVIKLDYETIKSIREYNDKQNNNYNDFTLTCTPGVGTECISSFLRSNEIKNGGLIESGTCKNITADNFYSCIGRN